MNPLPERLEGARIYLAKHDITLAPEMFHLIDINRETLSTHMPWVPGTQTVRDSRQWILHTLESWKETSLFDYGLFLKESHRYIGSLGLHTIAWEHRRAELGYWLGAEYTGCGYISEGLAVLEKKCFEKGFHRLEIRCSTENHRSAAVARRAGYRLEGTLRDHAILLGNFISTMVFAKLNDLRR